MAAVYYHTSQFPPEERLDWPKLIPFMGPAGGRGGALRRDVRRHSKP